jgi:hypothetical protein
MNAAAAPFTPDQKNWNKKMKHFKTSMNPSRHTPADPHSAPFRHAPPPTAAPVNPPARPVTVDPASRPSPQPVTPLPATAPPEPMIPRRFPSGPTTAPSAPPSPNIRPLK